MQSSKKPISILKYLIFWGTGSISMIVALFFLGIWQTSDRLLTTVEKFFQPQPVKPQIDIPTLVVQQIQGVEELTTTVYTMEATVPTTAERKLGDFVIGTTQLLYVGHGEVRAGIDLSKITTQDITVNNNTIAITLPPPKILDSKIDVDNSYVYNYDRGFLNLGPDVAPRLHTLAQQRTLAKIVDSACHEGILDTANAEAKNAIDRLLNNAGYNEVEINTTSLPSETCYLRNKELRKDKVIGNR